MNIAAYFCLIMSGVAAFIGWDSWAIGLFIVANIHLAISNIGIEIYTPYEDE